MKNKAVKITKVERALIVLAELMEEEYHYKYQIKNRILEILGLKKSK